jgi:hypothetical protein
MDESWTRPRWTPTGRDASLFFFIPGQPPTGGLEISRSRHHFEAFPDGLQISSHERSADPAWFDGFFARPGLGFSLDEESGDAAATVRAAPRGTVARGDFADPPDLAYLRNSMAVVSAILEQGGLAVLDLLSCRWWSPERWLARFVTSSEFEIEDHVGIVVSDDEENHPGLWMHTRGLRKFGRPDLQIRHVPGEWSEDNPLVQAAGGLLNHLAGNLCRGSVITDGQVMNVAGTRRRCTFRHTPDDTPSDRTHFGNDVLEIVDVVRGKPSSDLRQVLRASQK